MTTSVITPVYNCPELAHDYATVCDGCEVVIVDNASAPQAADVWSSVADIYVRSETNRHYMGGCNDGFAFASGDVIVFANNDIRGPAGSMARWAAQIKPGTLYGVNMQVFALPGGPMSYIDGWVIGATRETWDRLRTPGGIWDERIFAGEYANDLDLSWRATQAGIPLRLIRADMEHLSNYTSKRTPGAYDHADKNRAAFVRRVMEARNAAI